MGAVYPSDCLISLIPIAIIIGMMELLPFVDGGCPNCSTIPKPYVNICYSNGHDPVTPSGHKMQQMERDNFDFRTDNISTTNWYIIIGFVLFMMLSNYPTEFWPKSPYFFGTILAIYLF